MAREMRPACIECRKEIEEDWCYCFASRDEGSLEQWSWCMCPECMDRQIAAIPNGIMQETVTNHLDEICEYRPTPVMIRVPELMIG